MLAARAVVVAEAFGLLHHCHDVVERRRLLPLRVGLRKQREDGSDDAELHAASFRECRTSAPRSPTPLRLTCAPATCSIPSSGTRAGRRRPAKSCGSGGDAIPGSRSSCCRSRASARCSSAGRMLRKVITGYSGDTFPNFTPNPWFARAYETGEVEVEHWSFLAFAQRLEAAARGLPAIVTRSIAGSSMEANDAFARVDTPFGPSRAARAARSPTSRCCTRRWPTATGNVVLHPPLLEGVWGALARAARRDRDGRDGSSTTCGRGRISFASPRIGCSRSSSARWARIPGGLYTGDLPVDGYGEDYDFWVEARAATRARRRGVRRVDPEVGARRRDAGAVGRRRSARERVAQLRAKAAPGLVATPTRRRTRPISTRPSTRGSARRCGARAISPHRVAATGADAVLAGAGVANLVGVARRAARARRGLRRAAHRRDRVVGLRRDAGRSVRAQPSQLPDRDDARATRRSCSARSSAAPGRRRSGVSAARRSTAPATSTRRTSCRGPFLVGSGGGNDVASTAAENVIVATLTAQRTVAECSYITSPGHAACARSSPISARSRSATASSC